VQDLSAWPKKNKISFKPQASSHKLQATRRNMKDKVKCEVCNKEITLEEATIIFSVYFCKECDG
jgi:late competence protein required for DNA uptake (superfamily II DNA/RNA helicase)